jgi:hypothetical protein
MVSFWREEGKMKNQELIEILRRYRPSMTIWVWDCKNERWAKHFEVSAYEPFEEVYITPFSEFASKERKT